MKAIQKKLLLASVTIGVLTPFLTGGGVYAEEVTVQPSEPSNNEVEVNEKDYTINGETTKLGEDDKYYIVYGSGSINEEISSNTVVINSGVFDSSIYGGYSLSSNVSDSTVTINGGTIKFHIYGGYSMNGDVINNKVYVYGGIFDAGASIYGGRSSYGNAEKNKVYIHSGDFNYPVYGGYSYSSNGDAKENRVYVYDGTFNYMISGGYSIYGDADNNTVNIDSGTFNGFVHGGYSDYGGGSAINNTLNINGGIFNSDVIGGYSYQDGDSTGNTVNIKGGNFTSYIYGGWTTNNTGNATGNTVKIEGNPDLFFSTLRGGRVVNGTSSGNILEIHTTGLTAQNISDFQIINFYLPESTVNGDTILTLSESSTDISGAAVNAGVQGNANLNNGDTITLLTNAGTITDTGTTYGKLTEGVSLTYDLTVKKDGDNKIIATIGNVDSSEDSGSGNDTSGSDSGSGDDTPTVTDDSNNVKNFSGTDSGTIYGGYTETGNAQNNTINLYSGTFENIYGGYAPAGSTSNNTLNVYNKNISAQNLSNFSAMNFYIPNDATNGDTMLKLTDSTATDLSGVSIRAGVVAGNSNLAVGDTINLLQNSNGFKTDSATSYGRLTEGVSLDYGLNVSNGGSNILATITSVPQKLNDTTKSIPLGSGVTSIKTVDAILDNNTLPALNLDFDFEDEDDASAAEISDVVVSEPKGWEIFASAGGGSLRTKAGDGAYVDMKISNFDLGIARTLENGGAGKLVFAPIIDYAHGNYDSYLADGTHGTGSTRYIAGGATFRNMWDSGFYVEGSYRIGKVKNDFASNDMDKTFGQRVSYDTDATAMAGHLKFGRNLRLNKNNLLDVYATYYHSHQGSMNAKLAPYGDEYDISSANSGRFRIGYRMTTRTSKISRIYTGLAYQYEHASGITANYLAKDLSTASAGDNGSSGMLELGWQIKPLQNNPWMVDINATGWIGHQRGVTAFAKVQKSF